MINNKFAFKLSLFVLAISISLGTQAQQDSLQFDLGVGVGTSYGGVIGIQGELEVTPSIGLSAAIGHTFLADPGFDIGLYKYFLDKNQWQPRVSIHYGTNGFFWDIFHAFGLDKNDDSKNFEGFSLGLGLKKIWGRNGMVVDILYIATSELDDFKEKLDRAGAEYDEQGGSGVLFSIGYVHSF